MGSLAAVEERYRDAGLFFLHQNNNNINNKNNYVKLIMLLFKSSMEGQAYSIPIKEELGMKGKFNIYTLSRGYNYKFVKVPIERAR